MSFSALSREYRDLIYHALVCPPDGVRLRLKFDAYMRMELVRAAKAKPDAHSDSVEDEDEDENEDAGGNGGEHEEEDEEEEDKEDEDNGGDSDRGGRSQSDVSAVPSIPTAIFYVNRQIRQEAAEVFYRFNRFTGNDDAHSALKFFKGLRPNSRRRIKNIGFTRWSTRKDYDSCTKYWAPLCAFITSHMQVDSVTIRVPRDFVHGIDEKKEARRPANPDTYWWSAIEVITGLLMAGKIQKIRIGYSATLKIRAPEEEAQSITTGQYGQCVEPMRPQHKNSLENLDSVYRLRYRSPQEELDREWHEDEDFRCALVEGRPYRFASLDALWADQDGRRQRVDFVVAREDDPIGDVGTVLLLTRPTRT